jgi:type IV fimbrial biogenesis protein FimT
MLNGRHTADRADVRHDRGYTLIELVVAIAIAGILLSLGLSSFMEIIRNAKLRAYTEGVLGALQMAKMEAIKRNATVRFQFTNTLDSSCVLTSSGPNWVVSIGSAVGICNTSANPAGNLVLATSNAIANTDIAFSATDSGGTTVTSFCFNSLGQLTTSGNCVDATNLATNINFFWNDPTACRISPSSPGIACLRVTVFPGGLIRLCDPSIPLANVTDSRRCS